jgi:aspartate kinase
VAGVYSADPRIVPDARKLDTVSFEEMLEMAASGAGVLQLRSVEYARNHGVKIHVRSSFDSEPGTVVVAEGETMEQPLITAVTHSVQEARITLTGVPDEPGAAARIFEAMADANVNVDMIVQNEPVAAGGQAEISFTVPRDDLHTAQVAVQALQGDAYTEITAHENTGKVSIIGAGMRSHPGVAAKVFGVLAREGVNIDMISTSPIKISCVIDRDRVESAVQALHSAFELSGEGTVAVEEPFRAPPPRPLAGS